MPKNPVGTKDSHMLTALLFSNLAVELSENTRYLERHLSVMRDVITGMLDAFDEDDAFGTEGWEHRLGRHVR